MSERKELRVVGAVVAAVLVWVPLAWAQDNVEGPWGTMFGDNYRAGRSDELPMTFGPGTGAQVAWTFDPLIWGVLVPEDKTQIVFDSAGNLYWRSADYFATLEQVVSLDQDGNFRWAGPPGGMGVGASFTGPIVGQERVYALGHTLPNEGQAVYAFDKGNGSVLWQTFLNFEPPGFPQPSNHQPSPLLHDGKLYVLGIPAFDGTALYQIDAATGNLDWGSNPPLISQLTNKLAPAITFVPDKFDPGEHGLYVVEWECSPAQVFGIRIDTNTNGATLEWSASIGDNPWFTSTHLIYNEQTDRLYTYSFSDGNGYELFSFDPVVGNDGAGWADSGWDHGYYMTGALDFDNSRIITGGPDGRILTYQDDGAGNVSFVEDYQFFSWWHNPRLFCQLLQDSGGNTIVVTSTDAVEGDPELSATVAVIDISGTPELGLDGPTYVDDVEVWQGPDVNNLMLVWEDDFSAYSVGQLSTQSAWEDVLDGGEEPVWVVDDPTGAGQGMVLELDPVGNIWAQNQLHGGWHDYAETTEDVIVVEYKQWREQVTENMKIAFGAQIGDESRGHAWAWDISRSIMALGYIDPWDSPVQTAGTWQNVTFTYDFVERTSTVDLDGITHTVDWDDEFGVPRPEAPTAHPSGFEIFMQGTELSDAPSPAIWVQHRTGAGEGYLGVHLRGGPLVGPDGKIYYFNGPSHPTAPQMLVAIEPAGPATIPGDSNCDGVVNAFDIDAFVLALVDQAAWEALYTCDYLIANDINNDGLVDAFDIDPFVVLLIGP